jgi:hypothetical protein
VKPAHAVLQVRPILSGSAAFSSSSTRACNAADHVHRMLQ